VKQTFKIRHTQTAEGKVAVAREALGLANKYMDEFDKLAQSMIEKTITQQQFDDIVALAYPAPEKDAKGSFKKHNDKIDLIQDIYRGQFNNTIADTAWGAFNALLSIVLSLCCFLCSCISIIPKIVGKHKVKGNNSLCLPCRESVQPLRRYRFPTVPRSSARLGRSKQHPIRWRVSVVQRYVCTVFVYVY